MPNYVKDALEKLQYKPKTVPQYSPHRFIPINWTRKGSQQHATQEDTSPFLDKKDITYVQSVVGTFLYYARALDSTMLPALNNIGSQQAHPTVKVKEKIQQLMDYANTYPNVFLRYYASDMQLHIDTDAAYLVLPKAKSRIAGYYCLLNNDTKQYDHNGAILIECRTLRNVVSSAAEVETHGVFHNAKQSIPIR